MPDHRHDHERLISYVLGELNPGERIEFESHLASCASCASEARELAGISASLESMAPAEPVPVTLRTGVIAAVEGAAASMNGHGPEHHVSIAPTATAAPDRAASAPAATPARRRSSWPRRLAFAGGFAVVAVAVVISVSQLAGAEPEVEGTLTGESTANIVVSELGSGREVDLSSSEFPILPKGEAYEVWFVGPGDSRSEPNRISAGTFHPDEAGNTDVVLHAAVDPELYPLIEITAEPGSGNPAAEGPVVTSLDASPQLP